MGFRDRRGRYVSTKKRKIKKNQSVKEHDYCEGASFTSSSDDTINDSWRLGRRVVEFGELLSNLRSCQFCKLGPVALSERTVVGELQKGLSGYLYVRCENPDCNKINRVPYGKTHRLKSSGMPCFVINTKLGTGKRFTLQNSQDKYLTVNQFYFRSTCRICIHQLFISNDHFKVVITGITLSNQTWNY